MEPQEREELVEALDTIIQSQELFEEFENANYHSAWEWLSEVRDNVAKEKLDSDLYPDGVDPDYD